MWPILPVVCPTRGGIRQSAAVQLAEIGVMLLMFGVGLHLSMDDLLSVRRIALPGAVVQIAVATILGAAVAMLWDWPLGAGLVFGVALSTASTVVLLRGLEVGHWAPAFPRSPVPCGAYRIA